MKKYIFMKFIAVSLGISSILSATTLGSQQNSQDLSLCDELVIALNDNENRKIIHEYINHDYIKSGGKLDFIVKNTRWIANIRTVSDLFNQLPKLMNKEKLEYQKDTSFASKDKCLIDVREIYKSEWHHDKTHIAFIWVKDIENALVKGEKMDKKQNSDINFHFK